MSDQYATDISLLGYRPPSRVAKPVSPLVDAADLAPEVMGKWLGEAVALVLLDHSEDEPDPNVSELAHRILLVAKLGQGAAS